MFRRSYYARPLIVRFLEKIRIVVADNFQATTWFITGATGLVGSAVIEKLADSNFSIIALVRDESPKEIIDWLLDKDVKLIYGDLLKPESYKNYLGTVDVVVHTAAVVGTTEEELTWNTNYQGTKYLLEAMREYQLERFIHISTAGVYGYSNPSPISEDSPQTPRSTYTKSKQQAENLILQEYPKISSTILRPPLVIGERDRHVIPSLHRRLRRKFIPRIWRRDPKIGFVHVQDLASFVVSIGCQPRSISNIYNIQSFSLTLSELVTMVSRVEKIQIRSIVLPYSVALISAFVWDLLGNFRKSDRTLRRRLKMIKNGWELDIRKISNETDWSPSFVTGSSLELLLEKFIDKEFPQLLKDDVINDLEEDLEVIIERL